MVDDATVLSIRVAWVFLNSILNDNIHNDDTDTNVEWQLAIRSPLNGTFINIPG